MPQVVMAVMFTHVNVRSRIHQVRCGLLVPVLWHLRVSLCRICLLMLVLPAVSHAELQVGGAIEANTHWAVSQNPVVVTSDLYINGGATLTIDAGVQVFVVPGVHITVQSGAIRAQGTATQPVVVESDKLRQGQSPAAGDWGPWVFSSNSSNSRLDYVQIRHGNGLVIESASPVFNYLNLIGHLGAAITVDLASSPVGVGLQASACGINGIAVPAGDIAGSVKWGLRGLPYVVPSGVVSVGASPILTGVSPTTVEQGQTVTLTLNGRRLTGLRDAILDKAGLSLTQFSGGSSTQAFVQLKVATDAPLGMANLGAQVDAGSLSLSNAITVTAPQPTITSIEPPTVMAGAGVTQVTVRGRNFVSASEVLFNAASVLTTFVSPTELHAALPNQPTAGSLQVQVRSPDAQKPGQYLTSAALTLQVQAPVPPTLTLEPSPIALPPDGKPHDITVRLSKADYRDNTINLSLSDPSKASVSPASLVIPAGQTTAKVTITTGTSSGTVSLIADSGTLARVSVPLFITADFRGVNTGYAQAVGVVVQVTPGQKTQEFFVTNNLVGVSVGAVVTQVTPNAWVLGSHSVVTVSGRGLLAGAQVDLVPSTGLTVGAVTVGADGNSLQFTVDSAADAVPGVRRVVVKDAAGNLLTFADPARSAVQILAGLPQIDSIEPIALVKGTTSKLVIRGRNLLQGQVKILPDVGIRIDSQPVVSADGSSVTASVEVALDALPGGRVVQVITPVGATSSDVSASNSLLIVSALGGAVTPIVSPAVGVVVGKGRVPDPVVSYQGTSLVGVLVGAGVTGVAPKTGIIGSDVQVTVAGAGLKAVTAVSLVPSSGVSLLSGPVATDDGTQMVFTLHVDPAATTGLRRLVLSTVAGLPVTYARANDGAFLISAPVPELYSVDPSIVVSGQTAGRMTVRGRNLINASSVRIDPPQDIAIIGPFEANADGTAMTFTISVATGAASGSRTVIVSAPAGESSAVQTASNLVRVASQLGNTYAAIASPVVGVTVGSGSGVKANVDTSLVSPVVGVTVGAATRPADPLVYAPASQVVGVVSGSYAQAIEPPGWLQGVSGNLIVRGSGLGVVTSISVKPDTGVLLGGFTVAADGQSVSVPISVAPDAPLVQRELRLMTEAGPLAFSDASTNRIIGIGKVPTVTSMSPILIEQGKGVTLSVRGNGLQGVTGVAFDPAGGLSTSSQLVWSQDALGDLLTISVSAHQTAALGNRTLILTVPGGQTPSVATPANTLKVITPQ